jgi:alpha-ketoglutarate-dependent taurine dioxygenase
MSSAEFARSLDERGWAHLAEASRAEFDELARRLGRIFYRSDIRLEEGATQFAFRPEAFPMHMDSPRARYVAWYVMDSDDSACPLVVSDSRPALRALAPQDLELLAGVTTTFEDVENAALSPVPLVSIDGDGTPVVSYFPTNLRRVQPRSEAEGRCIRDLERSLLMLPRTRIELRDRDIVVLDNHRMLHGRGAMPRGSRRHLLRYWIHDAGPAEKVWS